MPIVVDGRLVAVLDVDCAEASSPPLTPPPSAGRAASPRLPDRSAELTAAYRTPRCPGAAVAKVNGFAAEDRDGLEAVAAELAAGCDWDALLHA